MPSNLIKVLRDLGGPRPPLIIYGGFVLLIAAMLASAGIFLSSVDADRLVAHTLTVQNEASRLSTDVLNAEASQRNFLITGDDTYLAELGEAKRAALAAQRALEQLTSDNSSQHARIDALAPLIAQRFARLEAVSAEHRAGRVDAAAELVRSGTGRALMARISKEIADLNAEEGRLLLERQNAVTALHSLLGAIMVSSLAAAAGLAVYVGRLVRRNTLTLERRNEALTREIAEREHVEGQLRQAQKMEALGRLTGGVAHDFNNMLAIILGNLDLMRRRLPESDRLHTYVENAMEGAKRAAALTQRLLAFSRLQPLDPKPCDVNRCVTSMSEMMRRTLGEDIEIETVLAGGLWKAFVDQPQLESALLNLAVNARDAMNGKGRLTIETANAELDAAYAADHGEVAPGYYVQIAITDTGGGMTPEIMALAFEPFFTTKEVGRGTGLGLSQVHGFIKQSRGHVKLYSELGVGTTVKLYLPRDVSVGLADEGRVADAPAELRPTASILVVEDDPGMRQFTGEALRELGYAVVEAENAAAALAILGTRPDITLMLTDVVMPEVNGRVLADQARVLRPTLKIIFMTGYTRNAIVHNGVLDSGVRLLSKPFTLTQLEAELKTVMSLDLPVADSSEGADERV